MRTDYHIHTAFSDDSSYPMEEVVEEAISKNLDEICFTDHVDYGVKYDRDNLTKEELQKLELKGLLNVDYPNYFKTIETLKEKYKDDINIKTGLEFGIQTSTIPEYEKLYKLYPYDFIINSCHQVDNLEFWNQEYQQDKTQKEFYEGYYKEILDVAKAYQDYSVLGHLDHHIRYDQYPTLLDSDDIDDLIDEILKTVIKNDRGIEVNTSCYLYNIGDLTPSTKILKRYQELGGKILTIGSDSHNPGRIYDHIDEAKEQLKEIGFSEFCTYEKMNPIFHSL